MSKWRKKTLRMCFQKLLIAHCRRGKQKLLMAGKHLVIAWLSHRTESVLWLSRAEKNWGWRACCLAKTKDINICAERKSDCSFLHKNGLFLIHNYMLLYFHLSITQKLRPLYNGVNNQCCLKWQWNTFKIVSAHRLMLKHPYKSSDKSLVSWRKV